NRPFVKAQMLDASLARDCLPFRERVLSNVELLGRIGCATPSLANAILDFKPVRVIMEKTVGISAQRSLPHYAHERFDKWFAKQVVARGGDPGRHSQQTAAVNARGYSRGRVILWDDTFVRYHEPHIGIAAVKVLETLGFQVALVTNRRCCGRPAFSQGNLDVAA